MNETQNKVYLDYVNKKTPNSRHLITMLWAFIIGGLFCVVGQGISDLIKYIEPSMPLEQVNGYTTFTMVFIGATLTGLGLYGKLGAFAGAGSLVPITGFANAVVAPAIEFKTEGWIYGLSAKMFIIAGPVIVYGVLSSVLVGLIYFWFIV